MANTVEEMRAEIARQDEQLAELFQALGTIDARDIPPGFFAELEEACTPRVHTRPTTLSIHNFQTGIRV